MQQIAGIEKYEKKQLESYNEAITFDMTSIVPRSLLKGTLSIVKKVITNEVKHNFYIHCSGKFKLLFQILD